MGESRERNTEYEVGYGKPPVHTRWQKGGPSPNPGGRPRDSAKAVRERYGGEPTRLAELLEEIAQDSKQSGAARVTAIRELWSRGWGTPASFEAVKGQDPLGLSPVDEEIAAIAAQLERDRDELSARRNARGVPQDPSKADAATQ